MSVRARGDRIVRGRVGFGVGCPFMPRCISRPSSALIFLRPARAPPRPVCPRSPSSLALFFSPGPPAAAWLKNGAPPRERRRGSANAGAHLVGGESRAVVGGESHGVGHLEGAVDEENHDEDVPALLRGRRGGSIPAPQNTLKSRARMRHEVSFCVACAGKQWGDAALVARGSCLKVESGSIGR